MTIAAGMCLILLLVLFHSGTSVAEEWHYGDEEHWPAQCQVGTIQSPIALSKDIAEEAEFTALIFDHYEDKYPVQSKNNGHSAEVRLQVASQPSITGGGLPHVYVLDHLHFHWSSEHLINNYRYPLELHFVNYANIYKNISEALTHWNGVAVFAVLFDLSPDNDREFEPLITALDKLHDRVDEVERLTFNLMDYLPRDTAGFYRYNGSLTTPGCTEGVLWTVFTNTLPISKSQVNSFALMRTKDNEPLPRNFRSVQDLNGRVVQLKVSPIHNSGSISHLQVILSMMTFLVTVLFNMFLY